MAILCNTCIIQDFNPALLKILPYSYGTSYHVIQGLRHHQLNYMR